MPPGEFLDYFFYDLKDFDKSQYMKDPGVFQSVPSCARSTADIYAPLVSTTYSSLLPCPDFTTQAAALAEHAKSKSLCPGFEFDVSCERSIRMDRRGYMKPHISCYTRDNSANVRASNKPSRSNFGYAEFFIDICTPDPSRDFFSDPATGLDAAARSMHEFLNPVLDELDERERILVEDAFGQHISYVVEIFARQPRIALFTVYMAGSRARLIHWDRTGCLVTESFDVREQPEILCDFLWRFARSDNMRRGHDLSVSAALPEEEKLFQDLITKHASSQLFPDEDLTKAVAQHYQPGQVYSVDILYAHFTASSDNTRRFIFSRPVASSLSLEGRGTRGYWAVDMTTKRVVFLKDTWISDLETELEGDTLRRLADLGVRNVPSLVWHGHVPDRFTDKPRKLRG